MNTILTTVQRVRPGFSIRLHVLHRGFSDVNMWLFLEPPVTYTVVVYKLVLFK